MEKEIILQLLTKEAFNKYNEYINVSHFDNGKRSLLFKALNMLRTLHAETSSDVPLKLLYATHKETFMGQSEKQQEKLLETYKEMYKMELGESTDVFFKHVLENAIRFKLSDASEDGENTDTLADLIAELRELESGTEETMLTSMSLGEALDESGSVGEWHLDQMEEKVKGLRCGVGTLFVARTDGGKTSWIVPQVVKMLKSGKRVLHLCIDEDGRSDLIIRYLNSYFKVDEATILSNQAHYEQKFMGDFNLSYGVVNPEDVLCTYNGGALHIADIENLIKLTSPDLVIYDQYQNIRMKHNSQTEMRTEIVKEIKGLSKKYNHHYLCATQADATAGKWVGIENIDYSKTGVPGAFRTIIGMGMDKEDLLVSVQNKEGQLIQAYKRYFNICKNKGPKGQFVAYLEPMTCTWIEE